MYRKLIYFGMAVYLYSCSQVSTNIQYYNNLKYKPLFSYDGSLYGHILFVANHKSNDKPNQKELESLAIYYATKINTSAKKLDYIKYIDNEFAQKSYFEENSIATVILYYNDNEIKIKQFTQEE